MAHWLAYAKARQELEIAEAIRAKGADAWVGRKIELYRDPTKRRWKAKTEAFLPNYTLITCSDDVWHTLHDIKGLAQTMMAVPPITMDRCFRPFMARIDADYEDRKTRIEAGDRVEAYEPGDTIWIEAGPLKGMFLTFKRLVETDKPEFPKIIAEVVLFGRAGEIEVDPLHVRKTA